MIKIYINNYIYNGLKKINQNLFARKPSVLCSVNLEKDKALLNSLEEKYKDVYSDNTIDSYFIRSFLQYKCQISKKNILIRILLNVTSVLVLPIFLLLTLFANLFYTKHISDTNNVSLVVNIKEDLIPKSLTRKYNLIVPRVGFLINQNSIKFLKYFSLKYLIYPYFLLKCIVKISIYTYYCKVYNPIAIIVSSEYSFTSSILTAFLETHGILHINVMHGEKVFNIRDSFFRFSQCFVWDPHYCDLFKTLKAYPEQFYIELPPRHIKLIRYKKDNNIDSPVSKNILKFYWASEIDENELDYIRRYLIKLKELGFKIIVRSHPLHKKLFNNKIKPYFYGFPVEDPFEKNIYESLAETNYVLGSYTTVLYESLLMGKVVVINDYCDTIKKLEELDYIVVKKGNYVTLSSLTERVKNV